MMKMLSSYFTVILNKNELSAAFQRRCMLKQSDKHQSKNVEAIYQ